MPSEGLLKLAEELKESREKAEISLQQIASKTRIDIKFLKAIEEGDFQILPDVYIRAFIKEYAVNCDLDPNKTLEKYDLARQGKSFDLSDTEEPPKNIEKKESENNKQFTDETTSAKVDSSSGMNKNKIILFAAIGIIVVAIVASYFIFIKSSSPDIVVEKPFEEVLKEQKQRYEITEEEKPIQQPVQTDSLNLSIKATDTCWVNVTIDDSIDKEFMLYKNTSVVVKAASKFDLIVGNAGGINIELNGSPVNINGAPGQRKLFSVNKDGLITSSN